MPMKPRLRPPAPKLANNQPPTTATSSGPTVAGHQNTIASARHIVRTHERPARRSSPRTIFQPRVAASANPSDCSAPPQKRSSNDASPAGKPGPSAFAAAGARQLHQFVERSAARPRRSQQPQQPADRIEAEHRDRGGRGRRRATERAIGDLRDRERPHAGRPARENHLQPERRSAGRGANQCQQERRQPGMVERHAGERRVLRRHAVEPDLERGRGLVPRLAGERQEPARDRRRERDEHDRERDRGDRDRGKSVATLRARLAFAAQGAAGWPQRRDEPQELGLPEARRRTPGT